MASLGPSRSDMSPPSLPAQHTGSTLSVDALPDRDELYPVSKEQMGSVRKATPHTSFNRLQPTLRRLRCRNMYAPLATPDAHRRLGGPNQDLCASRVP
jgi:hypothetical protein